MLNLRCFLRLLFICFSLLGCIAFCNLFDQFKVLLTQTEYGEKLVELKYDFDLARDSIIGIFRHRMRTVHQNAYNFFETIDWTQKILPQVFVDSQKFHFGKKDMNAL